MTFQSISTPHVKLPSSKAQSKIAIPAISNKLDMLLVLRGFACVTVVLFHLKYIMPSSSRIGPLIIGSYDASWLLRSCGACGVWIFFTLSGYLMGKAFFTHRYSLDIAGAANFYINRALRICPLYWFILGVMICISPDLLTSSRHNLINLLIFRYDGNANNGPLWSISTEVQFYLLVPFLAALIIPRITTNIRAVMLMVLVAVVMIGHRAYFFIQYHNLPKFDFHWHQSVYVTLIGNLGLFLLGFLTNVFIQQKRALPLIVHRQRLTLQIAIIAMIYLVGSFIDKFSGFAGTGYWFWLDIINLFFLPLFCAAGSIVIIYTAEAQAEKRLPLTTMNCKANPWRFLEWLGVLSYGIYVWHGCLIPYIRDAVSAFHWPANYLVGGGLLLLCSILVSLATYFLIERPAERLKFFSTSHERTS